MWSYHKVAHLLLLVHLQGRVTNPQINPVMTAHWSVFLLFGWSQSVSMLCCFFPELGCLQIAT